MIQDITITPHVGQWFEPMVSFAALPPEHCDYGRGPVEATTIGVICGHCTTPTFVIRHASARHVRACWRELRAAEANYLAEIRAGA